MGIHLLALIKLKLIGIGHGCQTYLNLFLGAFILKLPFYNRMSNVYVDVANASTLFFFRLNQILFQDPAIDGGRLRWERALRLFRERIAGAAQMSAAELDSNEASLLEATMAAL